MLLRLALVFRGIGCPILKGRQWAIYQGGESKSFFPLTTQMDSLPQPLSFISWVTSNGFKISTKNSYLYTNSSRWQKFKCHFIWSKSNYISWKNKNCQQRRGDCPASWWWWFSHELMSSSCNPMDCSQSGSSIHKIFQERILRWVAISYSSPAW